MSVAHIERKSAPMAKPHVDMIELKSGRNVAVHRLAKGKSGRTVVLCHPAPGAGAFDPDPEQTHGREVTLLAPDRPGYGQSDPVASSEWATVDSAADDIADVLEQTATGPIGVARWSPGGRVALALAARHPELVDRVVVIATPAPNEEVQWIPDEQQAGLDQLRGLAPDEVRTALSEQFAEMVPSGDDPEEALGLLGRSPADDAALERPGARERLSEMLTAAFAQGAVGLVDDLAGYGLQPWGFKLDDVKAKVLLLYGAEDPIAGGRHGTWWQKRLPDARLEMVPTAGHLVVLPMWGRALSHLAPGSKQRT